MDIAKAYLRGFGQVMLQENAITGALFLAGIFYNSWQMGVGAALGSIIGSASAFLLKYDKNDIVKGLYGANSVLVGIAVIFFLGLNFYSIFFLILGSILATILSKQFSGRKYSGYTSPFILVTWLILLVGPYQTTITIPDHEFLDIFPLFFRSFGQVMFQNNIITGILFLAGLIVSSRKAAFYSSFGVAIATIFILIIYFPIGDINMGLFGFNAVLCGVALADKKWYYVVLGSIVSVILFMLFRAINVPALTAPFVLATWAALFVEDKMKRSV